VQRAKYIGKTLNAIYLIGFPLNSKTRLAFAQGHPNRRAHEQILSKLQREIG
jgi:hypothetical protein